ncbi:MAG: DMT family transporter [Verrucomicrobia bacterium]|nr:DMT family transporter [Verrucomicrobiota bacterium]
MEYQRPSHKFSYAIPFAIFASLLIALMGAAAKILSSETTTEMMIFWRNGVGLLIQLPLLFYSSRKGIFSEILKPKEWKVLLIRGVTSYFTTYLFFFSLQYLHLTSTTLLFNTTTFFIPIIALIWMKIQIAHRLWWAIGTAFLGIIFVLHPTENLFQPASLIALASGILGAISFLSLRLAHYSDTTTRNMFYVFVIGMAIAGIWTLFTFEKSWCHLNMHTIALMATLGLFYFCYQACLNGAVRFAPVRLISTFLFCSVIFSIILDTMIWKTPIEMSTMIGFALIVIGAVLKLLLYPEDDYKIKGK